VNIRNIVVQLSVRLNGIAVWAGRIAAWAAVAMVAVIIFDVITRRFFVLASTQLQDLEWHLHAVLFLMTLGYAYVRGEHVRTDVLHSRFSPRAKAWVELIGILVLLFPFCLVVLWYGGNFVSRSFLTGESSPSQTGLPYRWIVKSFLLAGFGCLLLAAIGVGLRQIAVIRGWAVPSHATDESPPP
jgi:TRAP-type mannitol/chloroaromatic compound transport system permease small subunit